MSNLLDLAASRPRNQAQNTASMCTSYKTVALSWLWLCGVMCLQLLGLWIVNIAGSAIVRALKVPVPGNLAGMILLYALLCAGIVKVGWLETTGALLIRHLAFFFVPITVGLMDAGGLLVAHGFGIAAALGVSAAVGILLSGFVVQSLSRWTGNRRRDNDDISH